LQASTNSSASRNTAYLRHTLLTALTTTQLHIRHSHHSLRGFPKLEISRPGTCSPCAGMFTNSCWCGARTRLGTATIAVGCTSGGKTCSSRWICLVHDIARLNGAIEQRSGLALKETPHWMTDEPLGPIVMRCISCRCSCVREPNKTFNYRTLVLYTCVCRLCAAATGNSLPALADVDDDPSSSQQREG